MITFAVGIETKTRPVEQYFDVTLANLKRAGVFASKHLATLAVSNGDHVTRQQNAARAIELAVRDAVRSGAGWVMKLEDDLDVTDRFLENVAGWLADYGHARTCMFSLAATFEQVSSSRFTCGEADVFDDGTSFPRVREMIRRGETCVPHPARGYWGAQALVWRVEDAAQLVEWLGDDPALFDGTTHHRNRGHDLLLQQWAVERGVRAFACAVPSFVQHIGRRSNLDEPAIGHVQPFFEFPFAGRDYRYQRRKDA